MMIEDYQDGINWELTKKSNYIIAGLKAAGFMGSWLEKMQ